MAQLIGSVTNTATGTVSGGQPVVVSRAADTSIANFFVSQYGKGRRKKVKRLTPREFGELVKVGLAIGKARRSTKVEEEE